MVTARLLSITVLIVVCSANTSNKCNSIKSTQRFVYEDLKCGPIYDKTGCLKEYDCSHIKNKPVNKCLLRGKLYNPGDSPDPESGVGSRCDHASCSCDKSGYFTCVVPSDSCAEWWVPQFIKPGCYLTYELERCCSSGQKCPPFNNIEKCQVGNVIYDEGNKFDHPTEACTSCVCQKGFEGKLEAPFCQKRNCTTELRYSKEIHKHCAPLYNNPEDCCPYKWICPTEDDTYIPVHIQPPSAAQCKFETKSLHIGEKIKQPVVLRRQTTCECVTPPYLTCTSEIVPPA